jgi:hypothetical protein
LQWSASNTRIPESINAQLVGTFPSLVEVKGAVASAFFVRATEDEFATSVPNTKSASCFVKPQFVRTPHGPIVVAYCMAKTNGSSELEPFISETALFPRLSTLPTHGEIVMMLAGEAETYYVVCDAEGKCLFNSNATILDEWRSELAGRVKGFHEGKQITDEKTAIMSLYWYQERHSPSRRLFEISH